jgi:hypothetical protein
MLISEIFSSFIPALFDWRCWLVMCNNRFRFQYICIFSDDRVRQLASNPNKQTDDRVHVCVLE